MTIPETLAGLSVPVSGLKPYARNARQGDVGLIVSSLERLGQFRPIVVNARTSEVLAGNHTLRAAQELGWSEIAATFVDVDEDTAARINLVDNRANDQASYDDQALAVLLQSLPDLAGTGYDGDALDELLADLGAGERSSGDTDPMEPPAEPETRVGDLYVLGDHRLLCGDSTDSADVERLMDGESAALMATDPPYGVNVDHTWRDASGSNRMGPGRTGVVPNDDRADWTAAWLLTNAPVAYVWHGAMSAPEVHASLIAAGFDVRQQIIWVKSVFSLGRAAYQWKHEPCWYAVRRGGSAEWRAGRDQSTVWDAPSPLHIMSGSTDERTSHPTQKPLLLFERPIENHTRTGDVVYEPFAGSGTQVVAAENLGRRCFALELDPGYCDVIVDRWERHTGKTAERTRDGETVETHA